MKRLLLALLFAISLHAANVYYVANALSSPAGSDSNDGSQLHPWLTLSHAVNPANGLACGDTIMIVADGRVIAGDAVLPFFTCINLTTTIQSSALAQFKPPGYRTIPSRDCPALDSTCLYGRLEMTSVGIQATTEIHGSSQNAGNGYECVIIGLATDTITMSCNQGGIPSGGLANGSQVEFEVQTEGHTLATAPTNLPLFQKLYIRDCSTSPACGTNGATARLATTPGGTALSGFACSGWASGTPGCTIDAVIFTVPLQVTVGSANIVMGDSPINWAVNTPIVFSAVSFQDFHSLPSPLVKDTPYYITSLSSKTMQVSATLGGSAITITSDGTGPLLATSVNVPHNWAIRGLEFVDNGVGIFTFVTLGNGSASDVLGVVNHIEFDRNYFHSVRSTSEVRGIADNTAFGSFHDNYFGGFSNGEAQAIGGWASPGPTYHSNNFYEAAGQCTLYGGLNTLAGTTNANKIFQGNYCYKPPTWWYQENNGAATGACLYDATDPLLAGGQWYYDVGPLSTIADHRLVGGGFEVVGGGGAGGILIPTLSSGGFASFAVASGHGGAGYTTNFTINNSNFLVATGTGFSATVTVAGGVITGVTGITAGTGYTPANGSVQKYQCNSSHVWATTGSTYPGYGGPLIKPSFEHKNGRNFTYDGNAINGNYAQAQSGQAFNNNQEYGSGAGIANDHITVKNNKIFNVFQFTVRGTACGVTALMPCLDHAHDHVTVNNLVVTNPLACGLGFTTAVNGCGWPSNQNDTLGGDGTHPTSGAVQFTNDTYQHNTQFAPDTGWPGNFPNPMFASSPLLDASCPTTATMNGGTNANNIVAGDYNGEACAPNTLIAKYFANFTFSNNALLKGTAANYASPGATNTWANTVYPATNSFIKYVNADGTINGDYHLDPTSSPYSAAYASHTQLSIDGTDLGADIDLVNMASSGAIAGTPPWNVMYGLRVNPGSTKLLLSYQAPTTAACTATIYNAAARISANQVASVADSAASSISDVLTRQLYISGLSASTHYWYKLACGGGVLMVGDFFTRATGSGTYNFIFDWSTATAMRYSSSASMSSPTTLSAATRQTVPVATDSVIYAQVGTTGPITVLIAQ